MPVDYQKTKIYKIWSNLTEQVYIGATTQTLSRRMVAHRQLSNICASRIIIDLGDSKIELIEEFPCNNKMESDKKEGEYIRKIDCVNKVIIGRTMKEWREDNKEHIIKYTENYQLENADKIKKYYQLNKNKIKERTELRRVNEGDKLREQEAVYREKNKEKLDENSKIYYENNKEKILEKTKAYQVANKEKISEQKKAYRALNHKKIIEQERVRRERGKAKREKAKLKKNDE